MTLLETLILGSYLFTAGAYAFVWRVYRIVTNHQEHKLDKLDQRIQRLEQRTR